MPVSDTRQEPATITLVTGSFPPDKCGVGDYSAQLLQGFRAVGVDAECYANRNWRLDQIGNHWRHLRKTRGLLLMQHPTAGFDKRLAPFLIWPLLFWKRKVVTLHEFSKKSLIGKLLCYAFFLFSFRVFFTNKTERDDALRFAPWLKRRSAVIPIGSNIPFTARRAPEIDIAYFGLILPGKGIEEFLDVIERLENRETLRIQLIGQIFKGSETFADEVFARLTQLGASVTLNASPTEVAEHLATARLVLLPFPDGISSRRGSVLAAMGNGALVVSTTSRGELDIFRERCLMGDTPEQLAALVTEALANPQKFAALASAGQLYARSFDWREIAMQHLALIQNSSGATSEQYR